MVKSIATVLLMSLLQGCAYLTTYKSDVGEPSTGVAMDAKQRLLLVNNYRKKNGTDDYTVRRMCAEPSPDALSALGASVGASILSEAGATKQLAAALGESTASIGLRTTSIQLMRDAMYRACEAYLSGGIDDGYYASLQAHSQTLIVGLLAIEQLTGAVQAQQVKLTTDSGAGGVPDIASETDNLVQAKKATLAQQEQVDKATAAKSAADKAYGDKNILVGKAKADSATKKEDLDKLQADLKELQDKAADADTALKSQNSLLKIQQDAEAIAQQSFDLARTRVRAGVRSAGEFSQRETRGNVSTETAAALSGAVVQIVQSIVGTGEEQFKCLNLASRPLADITEVQWTLLKNICDNALANAKTEFLKKQAERDLYFQRSIK